MADGVVREDGFDIAVASEVMAASCLASDLADLKAHLGRMVVAHTCGRKPVTVHQLGVEGACTALLKDALNPNLVQTLENSPAFVHGATFANIAHGCNSVIATNRAMKMAGSVVTWHLTRWRISLTPSLRCREAWARSPRPSS